MATEPQPWSLTEMIGLARGAVERIDREGIRGATTISVDEIVAMAGVLALGHGIHPAPFDDDGASDRRTRG